MTYAFTHMGNFLLLLQSRGPNPSNHEGQNPSLEAQISALRPKSQPRGWDPASWLGSSPPGYDFGLYARIWASRLGFGPQGWDLGLEAGIWALRLEFGPRDWDLRGGDGEEEEGE